MKRKSGQKKSPARKILVLARLWHASGRDILSGLFRYLAEGHPWRIKLMQNAEELTSETIENAAAEDIDAAIITLPLKNEVTAALVASPLPAVFINPDDKRLKKRKNSVLILNDNYDIGRRGAEHLLACGNFASFGFVHARLFREAWSQERCRAFTQTLAAKGKKTELFPSDKNDTAENDRLSLMKWLKSLPKPAAVMAAADWRAVQVLDACQSSHIAVPEHLALLGVDNDEFHCLCTQPPLSSVLPDHEGIGYRAGTELDSLMRKRNAKAAPQIGLPVKKVVMRGSTMPIPPATTLVRTALNYIKLHAAEGITPKDVALRLGVSRRLAELRFSQLRGETIRMAIENQRLALAKKMLSDTKHSLAEIAEECGLKTGPRLSALFRKRFGTTPAAWRRKVVQSHSLFAEKASLTDSTASLGRR